MKKTNSPDDFATGLKAALMAKDKLSADEKKILRIVTARPSVIRTRRLALMERHARATVGKDKIDWSSVDWGAIFAMIIKVLIALLPLILAKSAKS